MERLRSAGSLYARFALEQRRYYRIIFMTPCDELGYGEITQHTAERVAPTFQFLVDRVRECLDAGAIVHGDPQALSATIWAHVHGHVSLYLLDHMAGVFRDDDAFLAFFETSLDRLFSGLLPR
jgi:hypothetical protein